MMETPSRSIRVFVSSTFRDMQAERELLVKDVFLDLRRRCSERFVSFVEVDLRWGITEEQKSEGKVLPICLEEIHECRPFFIGVLGERYGWIETDVPAQLLEREPWLRKHIDQGASITELEIFHGVMNNPELASHAFFYFRDPAYLATLAANERHEMTERNIPAQVEQLGEIEATRLTEQRKQKLADLKDRIRSGATTGSWALVDPYADPEHLAEMVRAQFSQLIEQLYPPEEVPDPLDQEAIGQRAFAQAKLVAYVPRPIHTEVINGFVSDPSGGGASQGGSGNGQGLLITGESGAGKSALLADWVRLWREQHPDDLVLEHYFGSTPDSASPDSFVCRLMGELKRRYEIADDIPVQRDEMRKCFPDWLARSTGKGRTILVLDALNQIEGDEPDRRLVWMPRYFAPHIRVIASSLAGITADELRARHWTEHELNLPSDTERARMVDEFFSGYRRTLEPTLRDQLLAAEGTRNPLFLRTVLEELRQFGSFENLPSAVAHFLTATDPAELFRRVIKRWQEDFDADCDLVRRSLRHLCAARMGLSEAEWLELLGSGDDPLARRVFRPLLLAMGPHLAQRAELLTFGHDFLRQAVEFEFLTDAADRRAAHRLLADYFDGQTAMARHRAAEWPWQHVEAEQWDGLHRSLKDLGLFMALVVSNRYELLGYWLRLEPTYRLEETYSRVIDEWCGAYSDSIDRANLQHQLGSFCEMAGKYPLAELLQRRSLAILERALGPEHATTGTALHALATILQAKGDLDGAESLQRRSLAVDEKALGPEHAHTGTALHVLATILQAKGDLDGAESLQRRSLAILEKALGPEHAHTGAALHVLATILQAKGDLDGAESLERRSLAILERALGPEHATTGTALHVLATILQAKGDLDGAESLQRRSLAVHEKALGPEHAYTGAALHVLATILQAKGDLDGAESLQRRSLAVHEKALGPEHAHTGAALHALATILQAKGDLDGAESLQRRSLAILERALGPEHATTATTLHALATILQAKGDLDGAESLQRRSLAVYEKALGPEHAHTGAALHLLATILQAKGDLDGAESLQRRSLAVYEKALGPEHAHTGAALHLLATILQAKGDLDGAESLQRRSLAILERALGPEHASTQTALNRLTTILEVKGDLDGAESQQRRLLE